jgi:hypothetical protein
MRGQALLQIIMRAVATCVSHVQVATCVSHVQVATCVSHVQVATCVSHVQVATRVSHVQVATCVSHVQVATCVSHVQVATCVSHAQVATCVSHVQVATCMSHVQVATCVSHVQVATCVSHVQVSSHLCVPCATATLLASCMWVHGRVLAHISTATHHTATQRTACQLSILRQSVPCALESALDGRPCITICNIHASSQPCWGFMTCEYMFPGRAAATQVPVRLTLLPRYSDTQDSCREPGHWESAPRMEKIASCGAHVGAP